MRCRNTSLSQALKRVTGPPRACQACAKARQRITCPAPIRALASARIRRSGNRVVTVPCTRCLSLSGEPMETGVRHWPVQHLEDSILLACLGEQRKSLFHSDQIALDMGGLVRVCRVEAFAG